MRISVNIPTITRGLTSVAVVAACLASAQIAGCKSGDKQKGDRDIARQRWNAARAAVLLRLAEDQFAAGFFDQASKSCDEALVMGSTDPSLLILRARLDVERNDLANAFAASNAAAELSPTDARPDYLLGIIHERWGRQEEALAFYQSAASKEPGELAYLMAECELLVHLERLEEAAARLVERQNYFDSNAPLRDLLGQVYGQLGRHEDSADAFRRATLLAPGDSDLREKQAWALMRCGRWYEASQVWERLTGEDAASADASAWIGLGECRMQLHQYPAARAAFNRATRLDDRNVDAHLGVARAAISTGDFSRAELSLARARAASDGSPADASRRADLLLMQGYLRMQQGQLADAAASFRSAANLDPTDALSAAMTGLSLERMGRTSEAAVWYGRALQIDPDEPLANHMLGGLAGLGAD